MMRRLLKMRAVLPVAVALMMISLVGCGGKKIPPLVISTAGLPGGEVGTGYSTTLTTTGGTTPVTWSVVSGALPGGLSLSGAGTISGTPSAIGNFSFTVQARDSSKKIKSDQKAFSIDVVGFTGRNNTIGTATPLSNGTFRASLSPLGDPSSVFDPDVDVYEISAAAGVTVTIEIDTGGVPVATNLDPVMEIVNGSGTRLTTCRNIGTDDGVTGANDPTPMAFDDVCLNDDEVLGVITDSSLELQVPASATTFYVRVLDWGGLARPDYLYDIIVSGAN